ncbi:MAG: hypothetical protein HWN66_16385 [Candidatus Helarchaeota archaeon]|nr:hypothetical protein [Candidatus Helarchaeota archaeon]
MSEERKIHVRSVPPPQHIEDISLTSTPDLFLIDYLLTQRQKTGEYVSYKGGTIATYISEQNPEIPLILFSTRYILNQNPNYLEQVQVVDDILYKDDVNEDVEYAKKFLITIVNGFNKIKSIDIKKRNWKSLVELMGANKYEEENLQLSSPPKPMANGLLRIHSVAKWILQVLFKYPGIFYNSLYAASALGISESSFLRKGVQLYFEDALYDRVFSEMEKRWWKGRLQQIGFKFIQDANLKPILSKNFMIAFQKITDIELEPSICVTSGETHANTVCYILNKPVKMKYTIGYLPDERPESMEQARVSYKAVIEKDIKEELIPKADAERLPSIRGG